MRGESGRRIIMKNNKIINLTQHAFTPDQLKDIKLRGLEIIEIDLGFKTLLNFETLPDTQTIRERATTLSRIAKEAGASFAMIGGAPYFMAHLEKSLFEWHIQPLYSFSERVSEEVQQEDGSVRKLTVFKHLGFIEPKDTHNESHQEGFDEAFSCLIG